MQILTNFFVALNYLVSGDIDSTFAAMDQKLTEAVHKIYDLGADDLALLFANVVYRHLKKGDKILAAGEVCRAVYLVDRGYLRTWFDKDGKVVNLNFTLEMEFAANLKSSKGRLPSEVNIEAGEDTDVWIFSLDGIGKGAKSSIPLAVFLRRLAVQILMAAMEHSEIFKIYSASERYHYMEKKRPDLLQRVPLSQIASYLGVTRETISRIRANNY